MVNPFVVLAVVGVLVVVGLSVAPYPGHCNVAVEVNVTEISLVLTTYFNIAGASATTTGPAQILDWTGWLAGFSSPALSAQFTMTVTADSGQTTQKSETQWFPSVPFVNGATYSASDTFHLSQVPTGPHSFTIVLTQSGQTVATGSTQAQVSC